MDMLQRNAALKLARKFKGHARARWHVQVPRIGPRGGSKSSLTPLLFLDAQGFYAIPNRRRIYFSGRAVVKRHPDCKMYPAPGRPQDPDQCEEQYLDIEYKLNIQYDYDAEKNEIALSGGVVTGWAVK